MSYAVSRRTREIGVRMALGALPSSVLRLVVAQGVRLTLVGVVLGLAGSLAAARLLQGLLFGVNPRDPITFAVGPLVLIVVAVVACFVPARRAARVDPSIALRAGQ
jgi:putative ABC transport system permease protein